MQNRRLYQEEGALFSWDCWAVHNLVSVWRRSACAFFTNVSTIAVIISRNHIFHVKGSLLQQFHIHHCLPQNSESWSNNQLFIYIMYLKEQYIVIEVLPTLFVKIIFFKNGLLSKFISVDRAAPTGEVPPVIVSCNSAPSQSADNGNRHGF